MADRDNRRSAQTFRYLIEQRLQLQGLTEAHAVPIQPRRRLSEAILDEAPLMPPAIDGIPGWHISALASMRQANLSSALDAAQRDARFNGTERAALVAYRRERPSGEQFVLLDVDTFAGVLLDLQGVRA